MKWPMLDACSNGFQYRQRNASTGAAKVESVSFRTGDNRRSTAYSVAIILANEFHFGFDGREISLL